LCPIESNYQKKRSLIVKILAPSARGFSLGLLYLGNSRLIEGVFRIKIENLIQQRDPRLRRENHRACQQENDDKKLRAFYDKRLAQEINGDALGEEFKGYVFKIMGDLGSLLVFFVFGFVPSVVHSL
jgi:hypothetical protein